MDFTPVKSVMDDITAWNIPGCDIAIMKDNKLVFRYQAGYSDIENKTPVKGDELYYLFSATKPIVGAAAVKLMEEGKLSPEDEVSKYISSFKDIMVNLPSGERKLAARPVRVIDLLTMTAGFDYSLSFPELHAVMESTGGRCPTLDVANAIAKRGLFAQPGEKFNYSLCLDVLGAVIEVASGGRFGDYLKKRFFEPLGMARTTFCVTPELKKQIAPLYIFDNEQKKPVIKANGNVFIFGSEYESGGAGLVSCVDDYIKFANMLTNLGKSSEGVRIMSEESVNFMRENRLTEEQMNTFWSGWKYLRGFGYGCGVRTALVPELVAGHFSKGEFGWCGAAGAMTISAPEDGITVYYAQHMQNSFEWIVHPKLRCAIWESFGLE